MFVTSFAVNTRKRSYQTEKAQRTNLQNMRAKSGCQINVKPLLKMRING